MKVMKAVSVISGDGFIAYSAPTYKPRGKPRMILLGYDVRSKMGQWEMISDDIRRMYPHNFNTPVLPPQGYIRMDKSEPYNSWYNAENQWFEAEHLLAHFDYLIDQGKLDLEERLGMSMVYALIKEAAK